MSLKDQLLSKKEKEVELDPVLKKMLLRTACPVPVHILLVIGSLDACTGSTCKLAIFPLYVSSALHFAVLFCFVLFCTPQGAGG